MERMDNGLPQRGLGHNNSTQNLNIERREVTSELTTGADDTIQYPELLDRAAIIAAVKVGIPAAPANEPDPLTHLKGKREAQNPPPQHLIEKALANPDLLEDADQVRNLFEYSAAQEHLNGCGRSSVIADKYIDHTIQRFGEGSSEVERAIGFKLSLRE